ncbi:SMP-30/gluconolactonase/LRE family protein [Saccharomonospora cyanea]|uniref:Gluconolactonase n=1 Tax=Saccharomonospora cyanea NA-134 TaxID=882082 RepID=H5XJU7_9PSEU|nr:SMP-30/gluconolactonase/LRE family protein [Saccharomonospora cyanea]EHR61862.1 gluconolactonase [Saccharomonospora cyanea NA-134]
MPRADQVTDVCAQHGEGPVWDSGVARLRWVDMLRGDVLGWAPGEADISRVHVSRVAAAVRPRSRGGLVVAVERGFALTDPDTGDVTTLSPLWSDESVRMNDGGCDRQGRFYCGSMAYDEAPGRGGLYRLDPDGTTRTVLTGVTISNGIVWSAEGDTVYYVDSPTQRIDAFDFDPDTAGFSERRTVVEIPPELGMPDGLALDADGGLWVALWGGGAVHRYTTDGTLDEVIEVGPRQVTSCAFGGADLTDLYITTSRQGVPDDEQPDAGALFRCRPGVRGLPAPTFAG